MLSIGGVVGRLELGAAPAPFMEQLRERYHPYTIPASQWVSSEFVLRVTFTAAAPVVDGHARAGEVAAHPLRVEESDDQIRIGRWDFRAVLAPTTMTTKRAAASRQQARRGTTGWAMSGVR